jgi:nucleoid-associated protein YgaU
MGLTALTNLLKAKTGELQKLKILAENAQGEFKDEIQAEYNPNLITIGKTANWREQATAERDVTSIQFTHGQPATLSIELLFDTYEARDGHAAGSDVRAYTTKIFALATIQDHGGLHRPPLCKLSWGVFQMEDFQWVLVDQTHSYTMFLADGTPVRATVRCSFKQWRSGEQEAQLLKKESADVAKRRMVQQGDTLSSIAGEEYKDAALWRPIAAANRIVNPRKLTPGQLLVIPVLHPSGRKM